MERQGEQPMRRDDVPPGGREEHPGGREELDDRSRGDAPPPPQSGHAPTQPEGRPAGGPPPPAGDATAGASAGPTAPPGSPGAGAEPPPGGIERTEGGAPPAGVDWEGAGGGLTQGGEMSAATAREHSDSTPLLPDAEARDFERRWQDVQVGFVDEPQRCVQEADALVGEVMQRLADSFARERRDLEAQWASRGEASTEDLRVALQRYRSFFNRLLRTS